MTRERIKMKQEICELCEKNKDAFKVGDKVLARCAWGWEGGLITDIRDIQGKRFASFKLENENEDYEHTGQYDNEDKRWGSDGVAGTLVKRFCEDPFNEEDSPDGDTEEEINKNVTSSGEQNNPEQKNMRDELKKAEEILADIKGKLGEQVSEAKKNPVKSAIKILVVLWVAKKIWNHLSKK